jgi:hypothetical protein
MAPQVPEEGWYSDPVDPTRRRWWDGEQWTQIVTRPVGEPEQPAAPAAPVMGDGTSLPYASDSDGSSLAVVETTGDAEDDEAGPKKLSRLRVLQMAVALVAILATAAVVFVKGDEEQPPMAGPDTTVAPVDTAAPTTTEAAPTTTAAEEPEPDPETEPTPETETEVPSFRAAYDACQAILDGTSIGSGGMDYQVFRDVEAEVVGPVTEVRFEATDGDGVTEAYLCRTLIDGSGDVMVGRLYLDLQNVLAPG